MAQAAETIYPDMDFTQDTLAVFDSLVERFDPGECPIATIQIGATLHICIVAHFDEADNLYIHPSLHQLQGGRISPSVWEDYCKGRGLDHSNMQLKWSDIVYYGGTMLGPFKGKGPEWTKERILTRIKQEHGRVRPKMFHDWFPQDNYELQRDE